MRNSSAVLNNFYTTLQSSEHQLIKDIEDALFSGQLALAQSKMNVWTPQNNVENTLKEYYQIRLNYAFTQQLSPSDSIQLYNIASSCEYSNGYAVSFARAFYNYISDQINFWQDNCMPGNGQRMQSRDNDGNENNAVVINGNERLGQVLVYPNPNNGRMQLWCENCGTVTDIQVMDISGKVVYEKEERSIIFPYTLNVDLPNGMYFVNIKNKNNQKFYQKVIITNSNK
jgi:hypothetical protein